jgi:DNA mismatch repair protein MutS2
MASAFGEHAFQVLDLNAALSRVAGRATSDVGREQVLALTPSVDRTAIQEELAAVTEMAAFLDEHPRWAPPVIPDARSALSHLGVQGSVLEPGQLHAIGTLLTAGRVLAEALAEEKARESRVWTRARDVHADRAREDAITRTVDAAGHVLDSASGELRRIRSDLTRAHAKIVKRLESFAGGLDDRIAVPDASITVRNGRYVVPVRREGRRDVGGIVHDESASGATLFIEPPLAIQLMNDLTDLERAEQREVFRILQEHSEALRPMAEALARSQAVLATFDGLYARARSARDWRGVAPELLASTAEGVSVVEGRHPLLLSRGPGDEVVPFTLVLDPGERTMVVSGPNTGGKTVFLKAVGLIAALTQCGIVPPVSKGTRVPVFGRFYADIGDEQSIAESLSTFSAHLANLRDVLEGADSSAMVLIDEMGTGTDPGEGAALARAILEFLTEEGALTIVTSHLGALKQLDTADSGVVNASLEFDPDRMEPTYRLVKGRPGRSYGLAIARRLGLPAGVLDRADLHLSEGDARLDDLLERLQRAEQEARELAASLADQQAQTARLSTELEERQGRLTRQEASADERAREEARRMLLDARAEVERAIREVKEASGDDLAAAAGAARRRVEKAAARHRGSRGGSDTRRGAGDAIGVGDRVRIRSSGTKARVEEVRGDRVRVSASGLRLEMPASELERVAGESQDQAPTRGGQAGGWVPSESTASMEADLRGLRVDEVQLELDRALDGAVIEDFSELRIIHGKGTGAVRQKVQELLKRESRVRSFRLGGPGEGGAGVTVAVLR